MNIREWPAEERPREKLLQRGAAALSDAELLAVLLGSGVAGRNVLDLARGLLGRFGGLRQFLEADRAAVLREPGIGAVKYAQLQVLLEIGRRYLDEDIERAAALESPAAVRRYLKAMLRHEISEVFGCLFLDTKHRPLAFEILFRGTIDRASVYPREVVRRALLHNAAALILMVSTLVFHSAEVPEIEAFLDAYSDFDVPYSVLQSKFDFRPRRATTAVSFTNNCDARSRMTGAQAVACGSQKSWEFLPIFPKKLNITAKSDGTYSTWPRDPTSLMAF